MSLDKVMTELLCQLESSCTEDVMENGTAKVELDKTLYACDEAARLWLEEPRSSRDSGFKINGVDTRMLNKTGRGT